MEGLDVTTQGKKKKSLFVHKFPKKRFQRSQRSIENKVKTLDVTEEEIKPQFRKKNIQIKKKIREKKKEKTNALK